MHLPRKTDVAVPGVFVHQAKQLAAAHGKHLFSGGIAAVVAENAAGQSGAQQHIGALEQTDVCAGFGRLIRGRTSGPSTAYNNDIHA